MIRKATLRDAGKIAEIQVASWQAVYKGIFPDELLLSLSIDKRKKLWRRGIEEGRSQFYIWEADGDIQGFAELGPPQDADKELPNDTELFAIYLKPNLYGSGTGTRFWSEIERDFRGHRISLWVLEKNQLGRKFYEKNGFTLDETAKKQFFWHNFNFPEVRYRKTIHDQN